MAAKRAFAHELLELFCVDQARGAQPLGAFAAHRPSFSFRERLLKERKIRERLHRIHVQLRQLLAKKGVIETALQMMHAGFKKALAMQTDPESNRSELP